METSKEGVYCISSSFLSHFAALQCWVKYPTRKQGCSFLSHFAVLQPFFIM